jgi:tryptophan synthase alpha subunit
MLLAPTSPERRIKEVVRRASGFIYCISLTGVTGARAEVAGRLWADYLARIRRYTDLPLAVGFRHLHAEHVAQSANWPRGAIVASALLNHLAKIEDAPLSERVAAIETFVRGLRGKDGSPQRRRDAQRMKSTKG